jgi:hypothetical protein
MSLNYTYREVELLQLFAKRAEIEEIVKLLAVENHRLESKILKSDIVAELVRLKARRVEVGHTITMLKEERSRIMAKIKQCQKQVEEGR